MIHSATLWGGILSCSFHVGLCAMVVVDVMGGRSEGKRTHSFGMIPLLDDKDGELKYESGDMSSL